MRTILLSFVMVFTLFSLSAQITLENSYWSYLSSIKLQHSGYKYVTMDSQQIMLYNLDHSAFRQVTIPLHTNPTSIYYLTETLFDTDSSNIEYMVREVSYSNSSSDEVVSIRVYEEDGTLLFSEDSTDFIMGAIGSDHVLYGHRPIFNTENGTKMLLCKRNLVGNVPLYSVYNLPGSLECSICAGSNDITGIAPFMQDAGLLYAAPNPANSQTSINYQLPSDANQGTIVLYDLQGNQLKRYQVDKTSSPLLLPVSALASGTYLYSLEVPGKNASTKKMVVVH